MVTSDLVLTMYIIKAERLLFNQVIGIDLSIPYVIYNDPVEEIEKNIGISKYYPSGLIYYFCGKNIPCIVTYSLSGGINQSILMEYLKK